MKKLTNLFRKWKKSNKKLLNYTIDLGDPYFDVDELLAMGDQVEAIRMGWAEPITWFEKQEILWEWDG